MEYRIYNFEEHYTVVSFEEITDVLKWLNENPIIINNCLIQYLDENKMRWCNF